MNIHSPLFHQIIIFIAFSLVVAALFWRHHVNLTNEFKKASLASSARALFMEKLAYEFKNPLNGILGFAEMLESGYFGELGSKQKERVHDIYSCGMQLNNLIRDFMELTKCERGMIQLIKSEITIQSLLERVVNEVNNKIKSNEIRIVMNLDTPKLKISCDQTKMFQVLKNIIDNAIKFSPKGGQVTINQTYVGKSCIVSISDSGPGMNEYEINQAYCFPDDTAKMNNMNGLGIGIPLSKLLIELHGGTMKIESEESLGATIVLTLSTE